jgi:hypothetical protein
MDVAEVVISVLTMPERIQDILIQERRYNEEKNVAVIC